jgi:chromate transporter
MWLQSCLLNIRRLKETNRVSKINNKNSVMEVFKTFLKLGLTSFGGPVAHIGYFRKEFVEQRAWVSEEQFSQLFTICQFLPGPSSSQLGFAIGLLRSGWLGAVAAFLAFTLPSAILLLGFASLLPFLSSKYGEAAINGLKLVASAVVLDAVLGMSKNLCPDTKRRTIALLAAIILLLVGTAWSQILVVIGSAIAGVIFCRETPLNSKIHIQVSYGNKVGIMMFAVFLALLVALAPAQTGLYAVADVFYRAGAMVFGGGHVVLPLLEDAIVTSGWVTKENFLAGYGAAQAIPGPMFSFSAYLGAIIPTGYDSFLSALVALVFMFLPGFMLLAAALPMWQAISKNQTAANAIAGVNAAVVGLLGAALFNLIFSVGIASNTNLIIGLVAFGMLRILQLSPLYVVVWCLSASLLPLIV